ncbi:MAG: hypothetical protein JW841_15370 [Deltaproteobacteria bacterium]|nr:hypothetical protein [Deltaproteobacteria bacterium]
MVEHVMNLRFFLAQLKKPLIVFFILFSSILIGCGQDACPPADGQTNTPSSPKIERIWLIDHPMPDDPWAIVLALSFSDKEGDLQNGSATIYLNGDQTPVTLNLLSSFRDNAIDPNSTSGTITLPVIRMSNIYNNQVIRLGVRIIDEQQYQSNCYSIDLKYSVKDKNVANSISIRNAF